MSLPLTKKSKAAAAFRVTTTAMLEDLRQTMANHRQEFCKTIYALHDTLETHRAEATKALNELKIEVTTMGKTVRATERWKDKLAGMALGIGAIITALSALVALLALLKWWKSL